MDHLKRDLGVRHGGEVVKFDISGGRQANVKLMNRGNYAAYRAGRQHRFYGGLATKTPTTVAIPHAGDWIAVVDLGGYGGNVGATITVTG